LQATYDLSILKGRIKKESKNLRNKKIQLKTNKASEKYPALQKPLPIFE